MYGALVAIPVALPVFENVLEAVRIQLLNMAEKFAQEQRGKDKCAIGGPVLVRTMCIGKIHYLS